MALANRNIVLGVSGGIAAYKAAELCRELQRADAAVRVIMTRAATEFVAPLTFATLTQYPVCTSLFDANENWSMDHIGHAKWGELLLVAPATANVLGKFAQGVADDALSTLQLAWTGPLLLAPAMNPRMWEHPAVRENVRLLAARGAAFVGPETGEVACGDEGPGRLAEPARIAEAAAALLARGRSLAGKRVLVTAGPTREYLDPVRFISNPSSGRMGFALAEEALARGAAVTVVAGPVAATLPAGVERIDVVSADEMHAAVLARWEAQDALIFAAAVGDYKPGQIAAAKIKKSAAALSLELERTPDIAGAIGERAAADDRRRVLVGFAAETNDLEAHARAKLESKQLDLIVANDIGQPGGVFGAGENAATLIPKGGAAVPLERLPKRTLASRIFDEIERLLS